MATWRTSPNNDDDDDDTVYSKGFWWSVRATLIHILIVLVIFFALWLAAGFITPKNKVCNYCGKQYTEGYTVSIAKDRNFLTAAYFSVGKGALRLWGDDGQEKPVQTEPADYNVCSDCTAHIHAAIEEMRNAE